jgi:DNA-directed RNA polymerase specialized sigma24 family protein
VAATNRPRQIGQADARAPASSPHSPLQLRRQHVANLLLANLPRLEAVARRQLTARTKRVHDGPDVASSVLRRIDRLASEGRLDSFSDDEVLRFAVTVARHQAISRTRAIERFVEVVGEDGQYAALMRARLETCSDDEEAALMLYRIAASIPDAASRQLFMLRWKGLGSAMIGEVLGISADAVRQRWSTLRSRLEAQLGNGVFDATD